MRKLVQSGIALGAVVGIPSFAIADDYASSLAIAVDEIVVTVPAHTAMGALCEAGSGELKECLERERQHTTIGTRGAAWALGFPAEEEALSPAPAEMPGGLEMIATSGPVPANSLDNQEVVATNPVPSSHNSIYTKADPAGYEASLEQQTINGPFPGNAVSLDATLTVVPSNSTVASGPVAGPAPYVVAGPTMPVPGRCAFSGQKFEITFSLASARITDASLHKLEEAASVLKEPDLSGCDIEVAGHADASGSDEINKTLSKERAQAALNELRTLGVGNRMSAVGYGESALKPELCNVPRVAGLHNQPLHETDEYPRCVAPNNPGHRRVEVKMVSSTFASR